MDESNLETPVPVPVQPGEAQLSSPITMGPTPGRQFYMEPLQPPQSAHPHLQDTASGGEGIERAPGPRDSMEMQPAYPGSMAQMLEGDYDFGDPFGLNASMAFPTNFSFDTSNMR